MTLLEFEPDVLALDDACILPRHCASRRFKPRLTFDWQMRWGSSLIRGKRLFGGMRDSVGRTNKPKKKKNPKEKKTEIGGWG